MTLLLWISLLACDGGDTDIDDSGVASDSGEDQTDDHGEGQSLYDTHCASCHASDGTGTSGPSLLDRADGWNAQHVADVAVNGSGYMSGKDVTAEEALMIGAYVVDVLLADQ